MQITIVDLGVAVRGLSGFDAPANVDPGCALSEILEAGEKRRGWGVWGVGQLWRKARLILLVNIGEGQYRGESQSYSLNRVKLGA